jgi:hypothetical protein
MDRFTGLLRSIVEQWVGTLLLMMFQNQAAGRLRIPILLFSLHSAASPVFRLQPGREVRCEFKDSSGAVSVATIRADADAVPIRISLDGIRAVRA